MSFSAKVLIVVPSSVPQYGLRHDRSGQIQPEHMRQARVEESPGSVPTIAVGRIWPKHFCIETPLAASSERSNACWIGSTIYRHEPQLLMAATSNGVRSICTTSGASCIATPALPREPFGNNLVALLSNCRPLHDNPQD